MYDVGKWFSIYNKRVLNFWKYLWIGICAALLITIILSYCVALFVCWSRVTKIPGFIFIPINNLNLEDDRDRQGYQRIMNGRQFTVCLFVVFFWVANEGPPFIFYSLASTCIIKKKWIICRPFAMQGTVMKFINKVFCF